VWATEKGDLSMSNETPKIECGVPESMDKLGLKVYLRCLTNMGKPCFHWDETFKIILVVNGPVTLYTDAASMTLVEGDLYIINANEAHCMQKNRETNDVLVMQIPLALCESYFPKFAFMNFTARLMRPGADDKCYETLVQYLIRSLRSLAYKEFGYELELVGVANLIVHYLVRHVPYAMVSRSKNMTRRRNLKRVGRIINFIRENYTYKISLANLAEKEGLDLYYLSHFIKKHLGLTFQQYVNKLRLEKAVDLLQNTEWKKIDVCMESGFSDYRYFCKAFEQEYQCTPSQFREKYKGRAAHEKNGMQTSNDQYTTLNAKQSYEIILEYMRKNHAGWE
jgi:AraC-like DNA-binding protein